MHLQQHPVAYASRSPSATEKNYAQIDKEALAVVFGVIEFQLCLLGRQFMILSDHKTLMYFFDKTKALPSMAFAHIQRWALTLTAYDYSIWYKAGKEQTNADILSRLPIPKMPAEVSLPGRQCY